MKKVLAVILIFALMLSGCAMGSADKNPTENNTPPAQEQTEATKPAPVPEEPTEEPTVEPTEQPTEAPVEPTQPEGYLHAAPWAGFMIFSEPSYDSDPVQPLPIGTYTIVDGAQDDEGRHWGKLKSGLGWICLSCIREFDAPVSIGQADEELAKTGELHYPGDDTLYDIPVVIQACEDLTQVEIYSCLLGEGQMEADQLVCREESLKDGKCLVVWLSFPGDLSAYEVRFVDAQGSSRRYLVSVSGRNGTIDAWERTE